MCKTLIVEDDTTFRHLLENILWNQFPTLIIEKAANGKQALQKVEHFLPDLIFMDIKLPDESGLELTKKIKTSHPKIIVIIISNYDVPEYRDAALRYGAAYFISKSSWTSQQIVELVGSILSVMNQSF